MATKHLKWMGKLTAGRTNTVRAPFLTPIRLRVLRMATRGLVSKAPRHTLPQKVA
jgi:hypothetical protein